MEIMAVHVKQPELDASLITWKEPSQERSRQRFQNILDAAGAPYVKLFGGGGGVIVHEEKRELENYGICQIFHPDDGRRRGFLW